MSINPALTELTACPRCDKSPLETSTAAYRCNACKVDFPSVGGIPWLFAEPEASLGEWRNRLHFALQQLATDSDHIVTELKNPGIAELTKLRLEKQKNAFDEHRGALRKILEPIDVQSSSATVESYLALRTRLPSDQGIATYYANLHRDWAWGDEENSASLEQIKAVAEDKELGNTLVLGAGACRLAYDIHTQLGTDQCVALDFNPLLLLAAQAITGGEEQNLYEFPLAPKTLEDFAVRRTLSAPSPVRDGFHLVLGDVLRPPFANAAFDTIVTPWLIDIVNEPLPIQAARINQLLKPNGRWINFGSLAFTHAERARCLSTEETLAIVQDAGFSTPVTHEETIPYMCSPASRHGRNEVIFSFAAAKEKEGKRPSRHRALPDWIVTGKEAVPLLQSFQSQAMSTRIHAFIMSLVDGKRTIADMAKILEEQKLMSAAEAVPALRTFMTRMYDDSEKSKGF